MTISFARDLLEVIQQAAAEAYPEECCGLLAGWRMENHVHVTRVGPSPNVTAGDPQKDFEVDAAVRFHFERTLRGSDEVVVGHYHSHPNGLALPSARDLACAFEPELVWLILATTPKGVDDVGAFKLSPAGGAFDTVVIS